MEKKLAVYICTGCGLGDTLDVDALGKVATDELKVPPLPDLPASLQQGRTGSDRKRHRRRRGQHGRYRRMQPPGHVRRF